MIRVQENRIIIVPEYLHCSGGLAHTHEGALALGKPHDDWHVERTGRFKNRLQTCQVRDVEMANGNLVLPCCAQHFAKCFHNAILVTVQPSLRDESIACNRPAEARRKTEGVSIGCVHNHGSIRGRPLSIETSSSPFLIHFELLNLDRLLKNSFRSPSTSLRTNGDLK